MMYRRFGQCPYCNEMVGPFDTDRETAEEMKAMHGLCQPSTATVIGDRTIVTPVKSRTYMRGDISRPFGSGYNGTCYECSFGYMAGDMIRMVTLQDDEKGKAMHEDCAEIAKKRIDAEELSGQSDSPPF